MEHGVIICKNSDGVSSEKKRKIFINCIRLLKQVEFVFNLSIVRYKLAQTRKIGNNGTCDLNILRIILPICHVKFSTLFQRHYSKHCLLAEFVIADNYMQFPLFNVFRF